MTKKIYLGVKSSQLYITQTGKEFTDDPTFRIASNTFHGLEDLLQTKPDLERAACVILSCVERKTRTFELYIGEDLQPIMETITSMMKDYFPNVTILKYIKR